MTKNRLVKVLALTTILVPALPVSAQLSARQIQTPADLIPGLSAQGAVGDYLLANANIRVVIDRIDAPHGFANTGGNIIDAATAMGEDRFSSLFTFFANKFGRQANYLTVQVVDDGSGGEARLRLSGVDSEVPELAVVTDYVLRAGERHVQVETVFTNTGTDDVNALQVGDALQWGLTSHFAPGWDNANRNIAGDGHDIGGVGLTADWLGGDGQGSSYGYAADGMLDVASGSTWSDPNVTYLDIPGNGGVASYRRNFIVGDGSLSSISDTVFALRGFNTGTLTGLISEQGTGNPIDGATITITTTQCLGTVGAESYTVARSDASGNYSARLEPGAYKVLVEGRGRTASACLNAAVTNNGTTRLDVQLSQQAGLSWTVTDGTGAALPVKISLVYSGQFSGPELGDSHSLIGGNAILSASGSGTEVVPPGTYDIWVSRGIEYDTHTETLSIAAGSTGVINTALQRTVDSTGYVSGDLHVHAFNSADSGIGFDVRAKESAAEGLEIVVPTDHDWISDMAGAIAATNLAMWVHTFPGNEVTTIEWGHFNAYPLTIVPTAPRDGALDHAGLTPAEIFSGLRADPKDPIVQINHPRAGGLGYFDLTALNPITAVSPDPGFSNNFEALEVFNGKRLNQVQTVLNDWYGLLNVGQRVTAIGNTDTHQVFGQEIGYPRNFVQVGTDIPSTVTEDMFRDAIRSGASFFTNGPFVEVWVNGMGPGSLVPDGDGTVDVRVRIQAPNWVAVDNFDVVVNGTVALSQPVPVTGTALRFDGIVPINLSADAWIAVQVTGGQCEVDATNQCLTPGCPGRLDPIVPPLYGTQPVCPFAHTNPTWVDYNLDGGFNPPGNCGFHVEPIAETREVDGNYVHLRDGEVVSVRGVVTSPSYTLDNRSNLVYLQDDSIDTGRVLSGGTTIYQNGLIKPQVDYGDLIEVTGTITQFNGLTELTSVSIARLDRNHPVPDPIDVTVGQLRNLANAEQWEGMLVRLTGVTISSGNWPALGANANITITDAASTQTITMRIDGDTDIDGTAIPAQPFDLVAVVGQFDFTPPHSGFYQLLPRRRLDIVEPGQPIAIRYPPSSHPTTSCSASISWYTNVQGDSVVEYGLDPSYGQMVTDATSLRSHRLVITGLQPATTYHYRVQSGAAVSADRTFTTAASVTPATVGTVQLSQVDATTVQVRWRTDIETTTEVEYGATPAYGSIASVPGRRTFHVVNILGLTPATRYHYRVRGQSSSCGGGQLLGLDMTFTAGGSCLSAPGEVSGVATASPLYLVENGDGSITAEFEELSGVDGYSIYTGSLAGIFDHGGNPANQCDPVTLRPGPGRRAAIIPVAAAPGYFYVTAFNGGGEGPLAFSSSVEVAPGQSSCAP